jgi:hypothetical protein
MSDMKPGARRDKYKTGDHYTHWDAGVRERIDQARREGIDEGRRQLALELLHQFTSHQPKDAA